MACAMVVPDGPMSMGTPHWMAAGLALAYIRAAAAMSSAGTQVMAETRSSGYSAARAFNSSKPWHHFSTNSLS